MLADDMKNQNMHKVYGRRNVFVARILVGLEVCFSMFLCLPTHAGLRLPSAGSVEVAFSPEDRVEDTILDALRDSHDAVFVQAYLFTSRKIAQALIDAHRRGVKVSVLVDARMNQRASPALVNLIAAGLVVKSETAYEAAHNKIILIDPAGKKPVVMTGSYNFTVAARDKNAENLLVLRDHPALALAYLKNWQGHAERAIPYHIEKLGNHFER